MIEGNSGHLLEMTESPQRYVEKIDYRNLQLGFVNVNTPERRGIQQTLSLLILGQFLQGSKLCLIKLNHLKVGDDARRSN